MAWDTGFEAGGGGADDGRGHDQPIELVGTHLRLTGTVALGRFGRLSDLINASRGYLRVRDARLLHPDGEPAGLELAEIMVDQDEISFIAQSDEQAPDTLVASGFVEDKFAPDPDVVIRKPREFTMFTSAHTITGNIFLFGETDLAAFVDSSDPRFVAVTDVTTRSLADDRITSHFPFVLLNRTQMIAAAEIGSHDEAPAGVDAGSTGDIQPG